MTSIGQIQFEYSSQKSSLPESWGFLLWNS